jgi:hypothetical protein
MTRINDKDATELFATMEFARDQLRTVGGKDSAAGQREEAARRLQAFLDGDAFKDMRETKTIQELTARLVAILPVDIATAIIKCHPHCAYGAGVVEFEAETESDALAMMERFPLVQIFNTERYKTSFMTVSEFERQEAKKPGSNGGLFDSVPWYFKVSQWEVTVESYVEIDGKPVRIDIKVKSPSLQSTARREEFRGGFRYVNKHLHNPHNIGTKHHQMWSPDDSLASFVVY